MKFNMILGTVLCGICSVGFSQDNGKPHENKPEVKYAEKGYVVNKNNEEQAKKVPKKYRMEVNILADGEPTVSKVFDMNLEDRLFVGEEKFLPYITEYKIDKKLSKKNPQYKVVAVGVGLYLDLLKDESNGNMLIDAHVFYNNVQDFKWVCNKDTKICKENPTIIHTTKILKDEVISFDNIKNIFEIKNKRGQSLLIQYKISPL